MKFKIIYLKLLTLILLTVSCNNGDKGTPMNSATSGDRDFYIKEALTKGDTSAYSNLSDYYMDYPKEGLLYPAIIMANKYDYHLAYADVYFVLTGYHYKKEFTELEDLDLKTRALALEYLNEAAKKGNKNCMHILGRYYVEGKYMEKDIEKGRQLIKESNIE